MCNMYDMSCLTQREIVHWFIDSGWQCKTGRKEENVLEICVGNDSGASATGGVMELNKRGWRLS